MMRFLACCVDVTESFCNTNPNHEPNQVVVNEGLRFKGTAYDTLWHLYKDAWISLFIFIGHVWNFWCTYCQVGFLKWMFFWYCLDVHKYQVKKREKLLNICIGKSPRGEPSKIALCSHIGKNKGPITLKERILWKGCKYNKKLCSDRISLNIQSGP